MTEKAKRMEEMEEKAEKMKEMKKKAENSGKEPHVFIDDYYDKLDENLKNEDWVVKHWLKLGINTQRRALEIHGDQLWNKILGKQIF